METDCTDMSVYRECSHLLTEIIRPFLSSSMIIVDVAGYLGLQPGRKVTARLEDDFLVL